MRIKYFYTLMSEKQLFSIVLFIIALLVSCSRQPAYPEPPLKESEVIINVNMLQSERPVFFSYRYHGKNINFFVIKIGDTILSFLDACMSCYPSKLGYRIDNGYITCRACNTRYSPSDIEQGVGGCFPIRIQGYLHDEEYHIPASHLENMADKF